SERLAE
ncbi:hypothetical protein LDH19_19000, partial [Mycobacterium tuberculosis]